MNYSHFMKQTMHYNLNKNQHISSFGNMVTFTCAQEEGWSILDVSENVECFLGYTREELLVENHRFVDFIMKEDLARLTEERTHGEIQAHDDVEHAPYRMRTKANQIFWVKDHTKIIRDDNGNILYYMGCLININAYQKHMYDVSRYQMILDQSALMSLSDTKGNIIDISQELLSLTGYTKEEVLYKPHSIFRHPETPKVIYKELWETIRSKKIWKGTMKNCKKDGGLFFSDITIAPLLDLDGNIEKYIAIRHDITQIFEAKEALKKQSRTDVLTGIGNRVKLIRDIERFSRPFVAIFDIARFNEINDFYGYELGDGILNAFVKHLQYSLPHGASLYRINADEFVYLGELFSDEYQNTIVKSLHFIHETLNKKALEVEQNLITVSVTTSLSFEAKSHLLLSADIAKNHAKKIQTNFCVYSHDIEVQKQSKNNILWASYIKHALSQDDILVYFQPIMNNQTLQISKYETLVRMQHDGKVVSPDVFLEIAKRTHQYIEITKRVIKKACKIFSHNNVCFSINLTMEDIEDESLGIFLWDMVKRYGVQNRLILEIVETENIKYLHKVEAFILKARSYGVRIAIDDFGTGYSNFGNLFRIKSDFIKIDGSLIEKLHAKDSTLDIVKAIVTFAQSCGSKTVAEYVSSEDLFKTVCDLGIDFSQGFFIGKASARLLESHTTQSV